MEAQELITEYVSIFAMRYGLGKSSLVKHYIKLFDNIPLKKRYWQILPKMYKEAREDLKEMLEIGAIWLSHSPWASLVVLVCKKDS